MENTVSIEPPVKITKFASYHSPEVKAKALALLAKGFTQTVVANKVGVPQTTVGVWARQSGLSNNRQSLLSKVKAGINQQVARITKHAASMAEQAIEEHRVAARDVIKRSRDFVKDSTPDNLVSLANALKVGVSLERQALGLNDSTESVIVRVDLIGQAKEEKPVIELDQQP